MHESTECLPPSVTLGGCLLMPDLIGRHPRKNMRAKKGKTKYIFVAFALLSYLSKLFCCSHISTIATALKGK